MKERLNRDRSGPFGAIAVMMMKVPELVGESRAQCAGWRGLS